MSRPTLINGRDAQFAKSLSLTAEWAEIDLEGAAFGLPSMIRHSAPDFADPELAERCTGGGHPLGKERKRRATRTPRARIVSLRGASVGELTLSGLDLRACLFAGAHNLEKLRLEGGTRFATNPRGDRQALAEEHAYRAQLAERSPLGRSAARVRSWAGVRTARSAASAAARDAASSETAADLHGPLHVAKAEPQPRSRWQPPATLSPPLLEPAPAPLAAGEVAAIYRALRKGREDNKDEPGAADFYYGEMEMRRRAKPTARPGMRGRLSLWAERAILWVYWLTSGYGLRGGRALIGLLALLVVFTPLFDLYGFRDRERPFSTAAQIDAAHAHDAVKGTSLAPFPPTLSDVVDGLESVEAWNYTAGTATALIGAPDAQLTQQGRTLRVVLRLLGPLFIGLALLSIRGRIKR